MIVVRIFRLAIVVVVVFAVNISAQKNSFTSSEGSFSIALPDKPTSVADSDLPDSKPGGKLFKWLLEKELMGFAVSYADSIWAKSGEERMRVGRAADGLIEAFEARGDKLISRRDIDLGDLPGVEVKYRKNEHILINRYYMSGIRLYFIMGICVSGPKESSLLKTIDSFQIIVTPPKKG